MSPFLAAYAATATAMVLIDLLWLGVIAKSLYHKRIGHLMAERPRIVVAVVFYLIYALGLTLFAVAPHGASTSWNETLISGALFGFFAYATYDLTNLATLKNWPVDLVAIDIAWGVLISAVSAAAGKAALDALSAA